MNANVAVFHPGTQHSWQTARALATLGRLQWFATSILYQPDAFPFVLERIPGPVGKALGNEFTRFKGLDLEPGMVRTFGWHEWAERVLARLGQNKAAAWMDRWGNRAFGKALTREIKAPDKFHLWGYDNSSLTAFEAAKRYNRICILDRTIGDLRAYNEEMLKLKETYGDWFIKDSYLFPDEQVEISVREHALADHILVGSPFAAATIKDHNSTAVTDKVNVLEYCFDTYNYAQVPVPLPVTRDRPVRFLQLGLAIPRKGIQHTLEAIMQIPESEASLTIVGEVGVARKMFDRYADRITYIPTVPIQSSCSRPCAASLTIVSFYHSGDQMRRERQKSTPSPVIGIGFPAFYQILRRPADVCRIY